MAKIIIPNISLAFWRGLIADAEGKNILWQLHMFTISIR